MDGAEIDAVIADAITTKALSDEYQRRADWAQTCANAVENPCYRIKIPCSSKYFPC
jgi:hypothetical protein